MLSRIWMVSPRADSVVIAHETDQTLCMSIKYTSRTPSGFMNGFPVLRMPGTKRNAVSKIMANNKPESMLYPATMHRK